MTLQDFYDTLDTEFQKVIDDNPHDQRLQKDKQAHLFALNDKILTKKIMP